MTWTAIVTLDKDKDDVGTVTATWTDDASSLPDFVFDERVQVTQAAGDQFATDANAALADRNSRLAKETDLIAIMEGKLNG